MRKPPILSLNHNNGTNPNKNPGPRMSPGQQSNDGGHWCSHSRSGRWRHLSCGLGCRPCWGCWRCPAEGWREGHLGSPGCRAYGAARRLLPWRCCPPSRSDSSSGEPFLEERSDQLHKNNTRVTMTQRCRWFFWHGDCFCLETRCMWR